MSACEGKIRFRTEMDAKLYLLRVHRRGNDSRRPKTPQRAYLCGRCKGWHLTSMPLGSKPKRRNSP